MVFKHKSFQIYFLTKLYKQKAWIHLCGHSGVQVSMPTCLSPPAGHVCSLSSSIYSLRMHSKAIIM